MVIPVGLGKNSYDIVIERGALERASEIFDLDRKVMIVTDSETTVSPIVGNEKQSEDMVNYPQRSSKTRF